MKSRPVILALSVLLLAGLIRLPAGAASADAAPADAASADAASADAAADSPVPRLLLSADSGTVAPDGVSAGTPDADSPADCLSLRLADAPRRFALLLRAEVPGGWQLTVSAGEVALTQRRLSDSAVLLLADGGADGALPVLLARLTVRRPPGVSGTVRVLSDPADPLLYYWNKAGGMPGSVRPAACFLRLSAGDSGDTGAVPEPVPETVPPLPEEPSGGAVYVGCQEASGASGDLCVRFLFRVPDGADAGAAVWIAGYVPAAGGSGAVRLTVCRTDSVRAGAGTYAAGAGASLLAFTYTGLPASGEIVFAVADGAGILRYVAYRDGAFQGDSP